MIQPVRIQRKRSKGFNLQEASKSVNGLPAMSCTRPGKWGNPFKVGKMFIPQDECLINPFSPKHEMCKDINQCIHLYEQHLELELKYRRLNISELKGKNLACFCRLEDKCHVDHLLLIANS